MTSNFVPQPPNPFPKDIHCITIKRGTELHRIYSAVYPGNAFHVDPRALNRFSPFTDGEGRFVLVLYAGETLECAIFETLFHDAAHADNAGRRVLRQSRLEGKRYGAWITERALTLASLHAPDLARFCVTLDQLTATHAVYYAQTARWAEAIHRAHPDVHGLEWTSYRASPHRAYVLFGDRVDPTALTPLGDAVDIDRDADLYRHILECAARVGVRVTSPRLPSLD